MFITFKILKLNLVKVVKLDNNFKIAIQKDITILDTIGQIKVKHNKIGQKKRKKVARPVEGREKSKK